MAENFNVIKYEDPSQDKEKDYIRLQPENDFMIPIILKEATILGKAIGLYRKF